MEPYGVGMEEEKKGGRKVAGLHQKEGTRSVGYMKWEMSMFML